MRNTRKIFVALLVVLTLLMSMAVVASAAKTTADTTIYLTPNSNWKADNARFALYTWDGGDQWFDMTDADGDGIYECTLPAGIENIIFCRMNPSATANNWNNKWNQTADLKYDGTNNHYTVKSGTWDKGGGTWSVIEAGACAHTPAGEGSVITAPTCTENGESSYTCSKCGETYTQPVAALGHTYDENNVCHCGASKYTVAGSDSNNEASIFGTAWDVNNGANDLAYDEASGSYYKVYENVPAGSYKYKVVEDHSWNVSHGDSGSGDPDGNALFTVTEAGSTVTIYFSNGVVSAVVKGPEVTPTPDPEPTPDPDPVATDYYLIGHIGGVDYGCNDDYANLGDYKFVDGKLTATLPDGDNYVFIKNGDNTKWFMAAAYCQDTSVTLANTSEGTSEKLYVPGGVELVFTLVENEDGTLTLSYAEIGSDPTPDPDPDPTPDPDPEPTPDPDPEPTPDPETIYIIAGDVMMVDSAYVEGVNFLGTKWDVTDESNMLVYDEALGCYVKVYENVFKGEYHFKVAENKSWDVSYGENGTADNCYVNVPEDGMTVTITFKDGVPSVKVDIYLDPDTPDHTHNFVDGKCECGETDPNYVPPHKHNFVEGKCECGETDPNYVPPHKHNFVEGKCECGETDPEYVEPGTPDDDDTVDPEPEVKLNFFQKIWKAISEFFGNIGNWFKNLFAKK